MASVETCLPKDNLREVIQTTTSRHHSSEGSANIPESAQAKQSFNCAFVPSPVGHLPGEASNSTQILSVVQDISQVPIAGPFESYIL